MTEGQPASQPLSPTGRTRLRRFPDRGREDRAELYALLDCALHCHLATTVEGAPWVMPMVYGRIDDTLYLHGSPANQGLVAASGGAQVCINVTHIEAVVLANTLFHHSLNFRSATVYATGRVVTDDAERRDSFRAVGEQLVPGRAGALPDITRKQLAGTLIMAFPLAEASVKVRQGGPFGEPADYERDVWGGVLPLQQIWATPEPDPVMPRALPVPEHVTRLALNPIGARSGHRTR